jgi:carbamoyl-phosphate synthase large subunit
MLRILVTAAGGAPAINFVRSLREAKVPYYILGVDSNKYTIHRAETDEIEMCPKATDPEYISYLNYLIEKYNIDFLHTQPDVEVGVISSNRHRLKCKTFLPSQNTVDILRDKFLSYEKWANAGIPVPETILLEKPNDLKEAYKRFGEDIWIREIKGAAGKGSLSSPEYDEALMHINKNNGWGIYTAAEKLAPDSVTWMAIYNHGKLIVAQSRERLYWEAGNRAQSGVTGMTGTGRTIKNDLINKLSQEIIFAVDDCPHGIFSVDMTYDKRGNPNATEINIGKFFTTHYFFTKAGVNFPEIYIKLAFGEEVDWNGEINPLNEGLNWIRGIDTEPRLLVDEEIASVEKRYKDQLLKLKRE